MSAIREYQAELEIVGSRIVQFREVLKYTSDPQMIVHLEGSVAKLKSQQLDILAEINALMVWGETD